MSLVVNLSLFCHFTLLSIDLLVVHISWFVIAFIDLHEMFLVTFHTAICGYVLTQGRRSWVRRVPTFLVSTHLVTQPPFSAYVMFAHPVLNIFRRP